MDYWNRESQLILKGLLGRAGISHKVLAGRLQQMGIAETQGTIAHKLSRGAFTFAFVLRVAAALGETQIVIGSLAPPTSEKPLSTAPVSSRAIHQ